MARMIPTTLLCYSAFLFSSQSFAEPMMDYDPNSILNQFKQKIGYDEAIKNEKRDGLIDIDFRKLKAPSFAVEWPVIKLPNSDNWNFDKSDRMGNHLYFDWDMKGIYGAAGITARVCENYECAQHWFFSKAKSSTMMELPWVPCSKQIGTACAGTNDKQLVFFVYKNVMIEVARMSYESGHEDFAEVMAEWLFDTLKTAPLKPLPPRDGSRKL